MVLQPWSVQASFVTCGTEVDLGLFCPLKAFRLASRPGLLPKAFWVLPCLPQVGRLPSSEQPLNTHALVVPTTASLISHNGLLDQPLDQSLAISSLSASTMCLKPHQPIGSVETTLQTNDG